MNWSAILSALIGNWRPLVDLVDTDALFLVDACLDIVTVWCCSVSHGLPVGKLSCDNGKSPFFEVNPLPLSYPLFLWWKITYFYGGFSIASGSHQLEHHPLETSLVAMQPATSCADDGSFPQIITDPHLRWSLWGIFADEPQILNIARSVTQHWRTTGFALHKKDHGFDQSDVNQSQCLNLC